MFISKKEFFKRKHKGSLYTHYQTLWDAFCSDCSDFVSVYNSANKLLHEAKDTTHLYNMIHKALANASDPHAITVAHKYYDGVEFSNIEATFSAYLDLHVMHKRILAGYYRYRAVLDLYNYLQKNNLTLTQKPATKEVSSNES